MDTTPERRIEAAPPGNEEAILQLLEEHLPTLRAVVTRRMGRLLRSREESLDIVQSACRRAIERRDHLKPRNDRQFRAWLLEIVENRIVDRYRELTSVKRDTDREVALGSRISRQAPAPAEGGNSPSSEASRNELVDEVKRATRRLPEELRQALELHEFGGHSYREVALRLGITPKQARTRVAKAKVLLARVLRSFGSPSDADSAEAERAGE